MTTVDSGVYGKPRGTTGSVTWGKARSRWGKKASGRTYSPPTSFPVGEWDENKTKTKIAIAIQSGLNEDTWKVGWNNQYRRLPGFQCFTRFLTARITSQPDPLPYRWVYYPTDVSLGAVTPTEFLADRPTIPNRFTIQWNPTCDGKWCAPSDTLYGFSSSAAPPDQAEFVRNLPHVERDEGEATVEVGDYHHDASVYVWGWWKHALSSYRSIWSPTRHVVAEVASGNPYYYVMSFSGTEYAWRDGIIPNSDRGTIAWWMNCSTSTVGISVPFAVGGDGNEQGYTFCTTNGSLLSIGIFIGVGGAWLNGAATDYVITPNVWHSCAVSSDGDHYSLWCDGEELENVGGPSENTGVWFGEPEYTNPVSLVGCQIKNGVPGYQFKGNLCNIFLDPSPWEEADAIAFHEWDRRITSLPRYYPFTTSGVYLLDNAFGGLDMRWHNDTPPTFSGPYLGAPT